MIIYIQDHGYKLLNYIQHICTRKLTNANIIKILKFFQPFFKFYLSAAFLFFGLVGRVAFLVLAEVCRFCANDVRTIL